MNEPTDHAILEAMMKYGGSFASALAHAGFKADSENLNRIKAAFPDLWAKYTEMANARKKGEMP